jgi:hypothetical protein
MLELLLNIVWVLIVTASLLFWRRLSSASDHCSRRPVTALVALVCILVLLFPVISATDDLHVAEFAMEDSGRKVLRHLLPDTSSGIQGSHAVFAPPVLVFSLVSPLTQAVASVDQQSQLLSKSSYRDSVSDRAPPALV